MGWASEHIAALKRGETVQFRPTGRSMEPIVMSGQLCTVAPVAEDMIHPNDVVLCEVNGMQYLHLVKTVVHPESGEGERKFRIGNNRGKTNGWITGTRIYGRLVKVDP